MSTQINIQEYIASGVVESYVLGLCSPEEKTELETMRKQYPELEQAITVFEASLENKLQEQSALPSEETDEVILRRLRSLSTPVVEMKSLQEKRRFSPVRMLAAAAVLLILVSGYFILSLSEKTSRLEKELTLLKNNPESLPAADYEIMKNPSIVPVAMYGVGIHGICRCTMFWDKQTGKMYIMIHHLPKSTSGNEYRLWAMVDDQPVNVGVVQDEIRGRFIEMGNVPGKARSFIVTLESSSNASAPGDDVYLKGSI